MTPRRTLAAAAAGLLAALVLAAPTTPAAAGPLDCAVGTSHAAAGVTLVRTTVTDCTFGGRNRVCVTTEQIEPAYVLLLDTCPSVPHRRTASRGGR